MAAFSAHSLFIMPLLLRSLHDGDFLIQGKNVRQRANRCDGERVDLRMGPGVVVLDVQEVGSVLEGWVVPVQVSHPLVDGSRRAIIN